MSKTVIRDGKTFCLSRKNGMWCCARNGVAHLAFTAIDALDGWIELYGNTEWREKE